MTTIHERSFSFCLARSCDYFCKLDCVKSQKLCLDQCCRSDDFCVYDITKIKRLRKNSYLATKNCACKNKAIYRVVLAKRFKFLSDRASLTKLLCEKCARQYAMITDDSRIFFIE